MTSVDNEWENHIWGTGRGVSISWAVNKAKSLRISTGLQNNRLYQPRPHLNLGRLNWYKFSSGPRSLWDTSQHAVGLHSSVPSWPRSSSFLHMKGICDESTFPKFLFFSFQPVHTLSLVQLNSIKTTLLGPLSEQPLRLPLLCINQSVFHPGAKRNKTRKYLFFKSWSPCPTMLLGHVVSTP